MLSTIRLYRREYDKAEQNMRQASHLHPNDEDVMILKGRVMAFRGRSDEALVCFETAGRLDPLHSRRSCWRASQF